jgi:hypothetical protein
LTAKFVIDAMGFHGHVDEKAIKEPADLVDPDSAGAQAGKAGKAWNSSLERPRKRRRNMETSSLATMGTWEGLGIADRRCGTIFDRCELWIPGQG